MRMTRNVCLGLLDLCHRPLHGRLEMGSKDKLSHSKRHVFFGDMGGNFNVLDTSDGRKLWGQKLGGAIGGGVISYPVNGTQKIAVAKGLTEILWPTEITTAKVSILGLQ